MTAHTFLNDTISISFSESVRDLGTGLARVIALNRETGSTGRPGSIRVSVTSSDESRVQSRPEPGTPADGIPETYRFRNRIRLTVNPERTEYHYCIDGYRDLYGTGDLKRLLVSYLVNGIMAALSDRLLLVHGALVANGDRCCGLVGPSGSGKSTAAARLPPPWLAVADDTIVAIREEDGYHFHAFPTWSRLLVDPGSFRRVDTDVHHAVSRLYFLNKADVDGAGPIANHDAVARLARSSLQLYLPYIDRFSDEQRLECKRNVLLHAKRLVDLVDCRTLDVSANGRFWEKIGSEGGPGEAYTRSE